MELRSPGRRVPQLWLLLSALVLSGPIAAEELTYFSERAIELDIEPIATGAAPVRGYQLWYTTDGGQSWAPDGRAHVGPPPIPFNAPADGEYGFRVLAVDRAGRQASPPQPGDRPEFSCVIDTRVPRLDVRAPGPVGSLYAGTALILDWTASDENFASHPVAIEYRRGGDQPWRPVDVSDAYLPKNRIQWFTPFASGTIEIRFRARDRAGNQVHWQTETAIEIVPYDGFRGSRGVAADPFSSFRRFPVFYSPARFEDFQIRTVEIWHRRGLGEWQRSIDADRRSPFVFEAEQDGRHSIYVRMVNLNDIADRERPDADTPPDMVVLVDTHAPTGDIDVGSGAPRIYHGAGERLPISWRIRDENLVAGGARLEFSLDDGNTWGALKTGIDTSLGYGEFQWRPPLIDAEAVRLRLVARDLAGNVGYAEASSRLFLVNPLADARGSARDHHLRAMALVEKGDRASLRAALERLELAINYDPGHAAAWHDRGVILTMLNDHEQALTNYQKAHESAPGDLSITFSLIQGHLNRHRSGPSEVDHFAEARRVFHSISKVGLYQDENYRELLATYRVLESALEE